MESIDSYAMHFTISSAISFIIQIIILIGSIIMVTKRNTTGTKLILIGSIFSLFNFLGQILLPFIMSTIGTTDSIMNMQIIQSYSSTFSYCIFGLGFILYATNDLKKSQIND